ncbi:MAG: MBOAT family protein [Planctomycetota bacterium]
MLFYEFPFIFVFLPLVLLGSRALGGQQRLAWLFAASLAFYATSSLGFLPLLLLSTLVDFVAGGRIAAASDSPRARKGWLLVSLCFNLGTLAFFKYAGLITHTLRDLFGPGVPLIQASLPVGISFYTFQSMSYTIDVYRGEVTRARSFLHFAGYVTLFPQLIAGPIVRYSQLEAQLDQPHLDAARFADGVQLFVVGLAKKLLLADVLAAVAAPLFAQAQPGLLTAWAAMLLYAGQIYWDFSGYSDMAIGLGRMLGYEFQVNFDSPYQATSFRDFWRRWHISLSTWLRDYLYIPLGGNRHGPGRTYLALTLTMLLGGLWHGASWNFVLWGAAHGLLLAGERALGERNPLLRLAPPLQRVVVLLVVTLVWVPFKLEGLPRALAWWRAMLTGVHGLGAPSALVGAAVSAFLALTWLAPNSNGLRLEPARWRRQAAWSATLLVLALWVGYGRVETPPFLYFRF